MRKYLVVNTEIGFQKSVNLLIQFDPCVFVFFVLFYFFSRITLSLMADVFVCVFCDWYKCNMYVFMRYERTFGRNIEVVRRRENRLDHRVARIRFRIVQTLSYHSNISSSLGLHVTWRRWHLLFFLQSADCAFLLPSQFLYIRSFCSFFSIQRNAFFVECFHCARCKHVLIFFFLPSQFNFESRITDEVGLVITSCHSAGPKNHLQQFTTNWRNFPISDIIIRNGKLNRVKRSHSCTNRLNS